MNVMYFTDIVDDSTPARLKYTYISLSKTRGISGKERSDSKESWPKT